MTSKTWTDGTIIDSAWLQDVNDSTYGPTAPVTTLRGQLLDPINVANGDALMAVKQAVTSPASRTQHDKNFDYVTSNDFDGIVADADLTGGGTDSSVGFQNAINWCAANKRKLKLIGLIKIVTPPTYPAGAQIFIEGEGDPQTYDSGIVYTGSATTFWQGSGVDVSMAFVKLHNLVFMRPLALSNVRCLYGDFYQGGAWNCVFRGWSQAVECFGSINTFARNRFIDCDNGILVTNWPLTSTQPGQSTTTFVSEGNNFYGCSGKGLSFDSSTTGGGNILSSVSRDDIIEQCSVSLFINKSFQLLVENLHTEGSGTWAIQETNSNVTYNNINLQGADASKVSKTNSGFGTNAAGDLVLNAVGGVTTRAVNFLTRGGTASFTANDSGGVDLAGAGIVGTMATSWTPRLGSTGGTSSGNTYSKQDGYYLRLGPFVFCWYAIYMTAKDAGMTGDVQITGLPFAASAQPGIFGNICRTGATTFSAGYTYLVHDVTAGTTIAPLVQCGSGAAVLALPATGVSATSRFSGMIVYVAA